MSIRCSILVILVYCVIVTLAGCSENSSNKASRYTKTDTASAANASGGLLKTDRGREIFQARCNTCHGISGNSEYQGNSLYTKAANLQLSKLDSISVANAIKDGREGMPSFGGTIPDSDMAQLVTYVKSLRKS